ncbi:MAG: hypothetical protein NXI31_11460 [bacterium]|nr:hypothetical protein [bacterium]
MRRIAAILWLLLAASLSAQVIHLGNYTDKPFHGWKRTTVDVKPPFPAGQIAGLEAPIRYVAGSAFGLGTLRIDVHVHLAPGQIITIDLADSARWQFERAPAPTNPEEFFGVPRIAGERLEFVSVKADGAAYVAHLATRNRVARMLHTDVFLRWYPDQPGWAHGEVLVTASNPAVPDVTAEVPSDFELTFGQAECLVPGLTYGQSLLQKGTVFGDGQSRQFPIVLVWPQHLEEEVEWHSAGAAASLGISAIGIQTLWPDGNPVPTPNLDPLQWTRQHFGYELARLHDWKESRISVTARSMNTGAQADQIYVGAECMQGTASLGAETVRYMAALGQARRPCYHLEADGSPLSLDHEDLVLWVSRPHWHHGQSPDQLGKSRGITEWDTNGWLGPDDEHWLSNTRAIAARLTGSRALQWQLRAQAVNWLYSDTLDPLKSTSRARASRAMGYAILFATWCHHVLEDREIAELVVNRARDRVEQVYVPGLSEARVWQITKDARLSAETGMPVNAMAYQNAMGAGLLERGCRLLGIESGVQLGLAQCKAVLDYAYSQDDGRWIEWDMVAVDPNTSATGPLLEGQGAHRTGWYGHTWFLPAVATVLHHDPENEKARALWSQHARNGGTWVTPQGEDR